MDAGALCLSSFEWNSLASRGLDESSCHEDRHKAPAHPLIRPLSLQDAGASIAAFSRQRSSGYGQGKPRLEHVVALDIVYRREYSTNGILSRGELFPLIFACIILYTTHQNDVR